MEVILNNVDELVNNLINLAKEEYIDYSKVQRAIEVAKFLHKDQTRKSGEPYIIHPLEVATILIKLGFDIDVVCAGILHDTVEDCGYSIEELTEEFGSDVAHIVNSVSAIDKAKYFYNADNIYEDALFKKESIQEQTFKKLVIFCKKNPLGLFVKFADRLHNLQTIEIFPYEKQLEKVRETEQWILPLAKLTNARYFYDEIKNICFKILNKNDQFYFEQYNFFKTVSKNNIEEVVAQLKEKLNSNFIKNVTYENIKEFQIFEDIKEKNKFLKLNNITQGLILKVSTYKVFVTYKGDSVKQVLDDFLSKLPQFESNKMFLIGKRTGRFSKQPCFVMIDKSKILFLLYFVTQNEFIENKIGTLEGQKIELIDDESTHKINTSYIKVYTRSNEVKFMPEGSTVLDFAFKIHQDIGLGFKYAKINNSQTQYPPYTVLKENDKIEIFVDRNKYNEIIKVAELKWFAYVETDYSKKILIKWFEKQLNK